MIYWAPLLHFYQPPTQSHRILSKVCNESYRPLIDMFKNNPAAKVTVNICAILTELLMQHGMADVIESLADLAKRGQVEFTGSAKYHPILPLIPQDEITRQLQQNYGTNRRFFGPVYSPRGFFPPEMCYSRDIVKPLLEAGCGWIILSGIACPNDWPKNVIFHVEIPGGKVPVFFRDDILSNMISFRNIDAAGFLKHLVALNGSNKNTYVVTAMDAETFGHHIKNWEKDFLEEVYRTLGGYISDAGIHGEQQLRAPVKKQKKDSTVQTGGDRIRAVTISELLTLFPLGASVDPKVSSWSTTGDDLRTSNPFPLWNAPNNHIHQLLWEHMNITIGVVNKAVIAADNETSKYHAGLARKLLDFAFHSDQFWWASQRPNWNINMINKGLLEQHEALMNGYKSITACGRLSSEEKREYHYREIAARDVRTRIRNYLYEV
ncbi:MAG: hypothetical protein PHU23_18645 [Dehalococcoidales bacterium]|nr:hypothetical protein [Dehalococcoidales bacterium]